MNERLVCTIITKRYLAHARVLAQSIREHNPGLSLLVLLADRLDGYFDPTKEPFQLIQLEDFVDRKAIEQMSFYYTPFEYCCALRGLLHDYVFNRTDSQSWIFLDSDILVLGNLDEIFRQIDDHSIMLNPHLTQPAHPRDIEAEEVSVLHAGIYNAGFLGLRRSEETRTFITWFKERLRWFCFQDHKRGFVDQAWLNHVPLFFSDVALLRTPGANLGHWRLRGRTISRESGGFFADENPISFVHFSGWPPPTPEKVSAHNHDLNVDDCPGWRELTALYATRLRQCGWGNVARFPYAFESFADGHPIRLRHRRYYYAALRTGRWNGSSPFTSRNAFISNVHRGKELWKRLAHLGLEFLAGGLNLPPIVDRGLSRFL